MIIGYSLHMVLCVLIDRQSGKAGFQMKWKEWLDRDDQFQGPIRHTVQV